MPDLPRADLAVFLVAGEESGDQLGASLMTALRRATNDRVRFAGLGGHRMEALGLKSIFPIADISVMGLTAVFAALPRILRRIRETVEAAAAAKPDVLVIIDSPDFTQRVARRLHRLAPDVVIANYVSPSVWAWRSGRARAMSAYIDRVLAILPFEPDVHRRLRGPDCVYVGHPLLEKVAQLRPHTGERAEFANAPRLTMLALPGSRRSEVSKLLPVFGDAIARAAKTADRPVDVLLPAVPHLADAITSGVAHWPLRPTIIAGEEAKFAAFRRAHVALAASGTATLELALAGVPQIVAYPLDVLTRRLRWLVKVPSIVLPNLILGENAIPEFIDRDANPDTLARALSPLLRASPERSRQEQAFPKLDRLMTVPGGSPSERAAAAILEVVQARRARGT
ncbi:MAG: lipid-A-disaccharide synthase [Bauldia sp.]